MLPGTLRLGTDTHGWRPAPRHHLRMQKHDPGVVISKVETGSRASVAGIKPYETITHVNEVPVKSAEHFEQLIAQTDELRLSIKRMANSRQVLIKLDHAVQRDDAE